MMVTKKHLSRRTLLRGCGVSLALPLLDAMVPALTALSQTAAKPVRRMGVVYLPNGMNMEQWTPAAEGAAFEFPRILEPLAPFRDRLLVLSGLAHKEGEARLGDGSGDHSRAQTAFLTGVRAKRTQAEAQAGISMDQIAARELGQHTQLASLELALEPSDFLGGCEGGYSCTYVGTISWRSETTPLPMEMDPRAVFERLFGASDSTDQRARLARAQKNRSVLDMLVEELGRIQKGLGPGDRGKLTEYVEAVRDIERRIQRAEEQSGQELPSVDKPAGVPSSFDEHSKLMFDLAVLAFQSDLTRIFTLLVGREQSSKTFPESGMPESWHPVSHHGNVPAVVEKMTKINIFHAKMFARFLEKMRSTPDGDGSLLDHSMLIYGAGLSNSNDHVHFNLPILLAGGGAGQIKGGRHLRVAKDTPMTNLHLTLLDKMGIPAEHLGDSTGRVELLSDV